MTLQCFLLYRHDVCARKMCETHACTDRCAQWNKLFILRISIQFCMLYSCSLSSGSDVSTQMQLLSACTHSFTPYFCVRASRCAQFLFARAIKHCIWQISVLRHCQKIVNRSIVLRDAPVDIQGVVRKF